MKVFKTVVFLIFMSQTVFSQDINKCREIVKITTEAINTKSSNDLKNHLAADFNMAGYYGDIAIQILDGIMLQLNDTIISFKEVSTEAGENTLTIVSDFNYENTGNHKATFVFDKNNKIRTVELFEINVEMKKK